MARPRTVFPLFAGLCALLPAGLPALAAENWVRTRYLVEVDGPVPAARYTLIQEAPVAPPSPMRALLTDAAGRHLVVESHTRREAPGGPPARRTWFRLADGGPVITLRFADPDVEIVGPGGVLAAYRHGEENRAELQPALAQVRAAAGPDLLAALATYARLGLAREPAFRVDAVLLVDALFRDTAEMPLQPERRQKLGQTDGFDPARNGPAPDEIPFGTAYGTPQQ